MPTHRCDHQGPEGEVSRDLRGARLFLTIQETNLSFGWCIKWSSRSLELNSGGLNFYGFVALSILRLTNWNLSSLFTQFAPNH